MKRIGWLSCLIVLSACTHAATRSVRQEQTQLWTHAHHALAAADFARADSLFSRLAQAHAESEPGRESLFFLGAMYLDPRNPGWDPEPSEAYLRRYLAADSAQKEHANRRPEALTLLGIAQQLNMPAEDRVKGLQPETKVVVRERVVTRASSQRALNAEVERLRRELAEKEAQIRQQREELERIRKTLTGQRR